MSRIACGDVARLKPKVIIAMWALRRAAGAHQINLRGHLVIWPKPSFAGRINR